MNVKKIGLIGVGAIGAPIAKKFSDYDKDHFYVIAGGRRKKRLQNDGVMINEQKYVFNVIEPEENTILDLIIICTKYTQLDASIKDIKNHVGPNTKIICFQNGVISESILKKTFSSEQVLYGFTKISSVNTNNHIKFSDYGTYFFGNKKNDPISLDVQSISNIFNKAKINHVVPVDMEAQQWFKFMCNVAENQVSAILNIPFGVWNTSDDANKLREMAAQEVLEIARTKGINIKQEWVDEQRNKLAAVPYDNICSMVQDLRSHRQTEVDMFSRVVIELGKEYGIPTPVNEVLFNMIKVIEQKNAGDI